MDAVGMAATGAIKTAIHKATATMITAHPHLMTNSLRPIKRRATMPENPMALARFAKAGQNRKNDIAPDIAT